MDYTICKNIINISKNANNYTTLLLHFTMRNNSDKVVCNKSILDSYKKFQTESIHTWIKLMDYQGSWKNISDVDCQEEDIFIHSCKLTYDKKLIVSEKEDYRIEQYEDLEVINKDEAICNLMPTSQININGNHTTFTTGNSSNIEIPERN